MYATIVAKRVIGRRNVPRRADHRIIPRVLRTETGPRAGDRVLGIEIVPRTVDVGLRTADGDHKTNGQVPGTSIMVLRTDVLTPQTDLDPALRQSKTTFVLGVVVRGTTPRIAERSCRGMAGF